MVDNYVHAVQVPSIQARAWELKIPYDVIKVYVAVVGQEGFVKITVSWYNG